MKTRHIDQGDRSKLHAYMQWLVAEKDRVHYPPIVNGVIERQIEVGWIRSFDDIRALVMSKRGMVVDCSQTVYALLLALGVVNLHEPNGNTDSLLRDLPLHYVDPRLAYVGAPVIYSRHGVSDHATLTFTRGNDPDEFSQGKETDPRVLPLSAERNGRDFVFCSIAHLQVAA